MKLKLLIWILSVAAIGATVLTPVSARAEVLDRILAVVNDEVITEQDLQIVMAPLVAQYRTRYTDRDLEEKIQEARRHFLMQVIEDKLILSEAKRLQVIVKDNEVEEMMADIRNKFPSREMFLASMEEQGLTEKKLWDRLKNQVMTQKLMNYEVKSRISVSPGEINEYYKANPEEFVRQERVQLQHILIRVGSRSEEEAKAFAESLKRRIDAGESFHDLAVNYSEGSEAKAGGQMGWMERGQLLGEIDTKVFSLKEGETTDPIQSSLGFHIFKVLEREQYSVRPLTEVRDDIHRILYKKKLAARMEEWLAGLKKNAYISIR